MFDCGEGTEHQASAPILHEPAMGMPMPIIHVPFPIAQRSKELASKIPRSTCHRRVQPAEVISQPQPGRMLYYSASGLHTYMMALIAVTERELHSVAFDLEDINPDNQVEISHFFRLIDG